MFHVERPTTMSQCRSRSGRTSCEMETTTGFSLVTRPPSFVPTPPRHACADAVSHGKLRVAYSTWARPPVRAPSWSNRTPGMHVRAASRRRAWIRNAGAGKMAPPHTLCALSCRTDARAGAPTFHVKHAALWSTHGMGGDAADAAVVASDSIWLRPHDMWRGGAPHQQHLWPQLKRSRSW